MGSNARGLYEVLITEAIEAQLRDLDSTLHATRSALRSAEAPDRLALHLGRLIQRAIAGLEELGVVPKPVRDLVRRVEAEGGAAKVSGAGSAYGPGAGCLLVYHPEPERIAGWSFLEGLSFYPVRLGAAGLRAEGTERME